MVLLFEIFIDCIYWNIVIIKLLIFSVNYIIVSIYFLVVDEIKES